MPSYRIGIDIGGTFTDFVLVDEDTGAMRRSTRSSRRPRDPSEAVLDGVATCSPAAGVADRRRSARSCTARRWSPTR